MIRPLDNLATGPSQPSSSLPFSVLNGGLATMATGATRPSNMMGPAMRSLNDLVVGDISLPSGSAGYGNAPQTYLPNAALNYPMYGTSFKHVDSIPTLGTMMWMIQDQKRERTARFSFPGQGGMSTNTTHYTGLTNGMNKRAHPMSTPEGLNYYLLHKQLAKFNLDRKNGVRHESLPPIEVADMFALSGVCISRIQALNHASLTTTWQGRANYINNLGVDELPRAAKIYVVFKRTARENIPKSFCLSPYMNNAEQSRSRKNVVSIETVDDTFTPVLAYPVVLADGARLSSDYLIDEFGNADGAAFYFGHVFHNEDYNPNRATSYGKTTDPEDMHPFSDAGNVNDRGLLEVNVEIKRVR